MYHIILEAIRAICREDELGINISLAQAETLADAISIEVDNSTECYHVFAYGGVKYKDGNEALPGGSARDRKYFDWWYCTKCLEATYKKLDIAQDTYDKILFNASPKER